MKVYGPNKPCPTPWDDILSTSIGSDSGETISWEVVLDDNGNVLTKGF